jgi:hypothetical protein
MAVLEIQGNKTKGDDIARRMNQLRGGSRAAHAE